MGMYRKKLRFYPTVKKSSTFFTYFPARFSALRLKINQKQVAEMSSDI